MQPRRYQDIARGAPPKTRGKPPALNAPMMQTAPSAPAVFSGGGDRQSRRSGRGRYCGRHRPGGRLILALANYESLACHLGRLRQWLARDLLGRPRALDRPYWEIPHDHYHKGELSFVRELGGPWFRLERGYGVSLLWLIYGWERLLDRLPRALALGLLATLDRIAHRTPALADMIVSVWQPRERVGAT